MFITSQRGWYDRDGGQRASGSFLLLFNRQSGGELRALVRHIRLEQFGHFMMGRVTIKLPIGEAVELTVSGAYGSDGLPIGAADSETTVLGHVYPPEKGAALWPFAHPLPADLTAAFWAGGGHNSAGSEGPSLAAWVREHINELRRLRSTDSAT